MLNVSLYFTNQIYTPSVFCKILHFKMRKDIKNMRHPEFSNKTMKAVFYNYSLFFCKQKKACFETFLSERAIF